ncbi:MAG: acyltransferase [Candidatus Eremiobacteraeota bacterium]|nr:acyltransferase [Candidatus Eremiobacteraeota bacterium]
MHVWSIGCGAPSLRLPWIHVDLNRIISMIGTGVDLFFVISGFCMYLMYAGKQSAFSGTAYRAFLINRWRRIAPAFYAAVAACAIIAYARDGHWLWTEIGANLIFAQLWIGNGRLNGVFWSLATEWHFYLVLPLLIWGAVRGGFWATLGGLAIFSIAARIGQSYWLRDIQDKNLPFRLIEFVWGIGVARLYRDGIVPSGPFRGARGALLAVAVAYLGRLLTVTEIVEAAGRAGPLFRAFASPLLTFGYALLLWNVVGSESIVSTTLASVPMRTLGRWSYSIYLWHLYPSVWIASALVTRFGNGGLMPYVATVSALLIVVPISIFSYRWFEAPYFRKRPARLASRVLTQEGGL